MNENCVPPFTEYLANGSVTTGIYLLGISTFMGLDGEIVGVQAFDWASRNPKLVTAATLYGRLIDHIRGLRVLNFIKEFHLLKSFVS